MHFSAFTLLVLSPLTLAAPISAPVDQRRSLFLDLPLHRRLILFKRGLFSEALKFSDLGTPVGVGVAIANILKGPQQACTSDLLSSAFLHQNHHPVRFLRIPGPPALPQITRVDTVFSQVTMRNKSLPQSEREKPPRERTRSETVRWQA